MGCIQSTALTYAAREEEALGPPTKTMDASDYAKTLVNLVSKEIELELGKTPINRKFTATQMITREVTSLDGKNNGTMYYVKAKTTLKKWPWIFVKIYEPPLVTNVSPVTFKGLKKMNQDFKLVTF